jgi:ribonuclease P protein component
LNFPRDQRLVTKAEFKQVFDEANKIAQKYLLVLIRPNKTNKARLGIIVGKRFVNTAVARNRIKRIVRESFRSRQHHLIGWDIVVIARQHCGTLDKDKLRKGIDNLWERLLTQYPNQSSS